MTDIKIDKVKLVNILAEIRATMEYDLPKAKQKLSRLQTNILEEKGRLFNE